MKKRFVKNTICLLLLCLSIIPVTVSAITYYVRFNPNGGSGTMSNQTFTTDEEKYLSTNTFTRTGYSFIGWNKNSSGTSTWYMPNVKYKNLTSTSGATVDVYAQWMETNQSSMTINGSQAPKDGANNYALDNYKNFTVSVTVVNGTVSPASKTVEYYTSPTFTISGATGTYNPTVSCTNSQSASISGSTLTVTNVSNNTTCTVTYQMRPYKLTADPQSGDMTPTSGWSYTNGGINTNSLPSTYKELEFIESTGAQYIDSGYKPKSNTGVEVKYSISDLYLQERIFGVENSASNFYSLYINSQGNWAYTYNDAVGNWINTGVSAVPNEIHTFKLNVTPGYWSYDNSSNTALSGSVSTTSSGNLYIMARNFETSGADYYANMRLYSFKIYEGGTLVKNYVPCYRVSDNAIGLYDTKTSTFYTNSGTGELTGGISDTAYKNLTYGSEYGILPTPVREDYRFDGWYTAATGGTQVTSSTTMSTSDRTIYAHWTREYTIIYNNNTGNSINRQTKISGTNTNILSEEPTRSGYAFLGWATVSAATNTSGTWYDPGDSYSTDADLTLYAQWYNVNSLEQSYTTFIQSGDFDHISPYETYQITSGEDYLPTNTYPTMSGYTTKGYVNYSTNWDGGLRIYGVDQDQIKFRNLSSSGGSVKITKYYLATKNRTAITYTDDIDSRIDRLQKLQDVSLTYSNIQRKAVTKDNLTISSRTTGNVQIASHTNAEIIMPAGYNLSNASSSGTYVSRAYLDKFTISNGTTATISANIAKTVSSVTPKVQISVAYVVVDKKTSRTTTYAPTEYSTKGLSRYVALSALNTAKSNYFPASYIKRYTRVEGGTGSIAAWGTATATKSLSIPNGKILGSAGQGVTNASGGDGSSYSVINKAYVAVGDSTPTSGTYNMTWYPGNTLYSSTTGYAQTKVFGWGHIWYISSGTLTVS